jgi:predicted transcriptional regulator
MENPPAWLEVRSPVPTFRDSFILGTGESEAIALAEQLGAYRIVMDESLAAQLIAAGKDPSRAALEALAAYQHLLDLIDEPETREGIRRGLADAAAGRTRPAREVSDELRAKYRIPSLH